MQKRFEAARYRRYRPITRPITRPLRLRLSPSFRWRMAIKLAFRLGFAEPEIEPVARGDQHGRSDQAGQDVHNVMVAAIHGGKAEQEGDREVDITDAPQIAEGERHRA